MKCNKQTKKKWTILNKVCLICASIYTVKYIDSFFGILYFVLFKRGHQLVLLALIQISHSWSTWISIYFILFFFHHKHVKCHRIALVFLFYLRNFMYLLVVHEKGITSKWLKLLCCNIINCWIQYSWQYRQTLGCFFFKEEVMTHL